MIINLSEKPSILGEYLADLRDVKVQKDSMRFRNNLSRIGSLMAYEISKSFDFKTQSVKTPLGTARQKVVEYQPILATILRAGLWMHNGFLDIFDKAESIFISAYRKHSNEDEFEIEVEYMAGPSIEDKALIISDPMLATGRSMFSVYHALLKNGTPQRTLLAAMISSPEALNI
jgi:uracil phosphoribosyltransferase